MAQCGRKWPNVILGGGKVIPKYRNCNLFTGKGGKKCCASGQKKSVSKKSTSIGVLVKNLKEMMCEAIF